jgi:1-deoxy-D-xylulose-5-phosphate reductoisomerase
VKGVAILGATGSIGRATLDVVRSLGCDFGVTGLAAGSRWEPLVEAVAEFNPRLVALADAEAAERLKTALRSEEVEIISGPDAATRVATDEDADVVVSAIVGAAGLEPTLAATRLGKRVALANKEALVMAGPLMLDEAARSGATLLPVDSEHSAIFQARIAGRPQEVRRIVLTASGGPFRGCSADDLERVTAAEALDHPTWSMGPKITVDSATLVNKALEVIEARWLFDVDPGRIEVWIHPQSVVHSMVEFVDGSIVAQLGATDMRLPIQYALTYPERRPGPLAGFQLEDMASLTFEKPDTARFPGLELGFRAAREGGTAPAVLNAANEVAVGTFLSGGCLFTDIPRTIHEVMDRRDVVDEPTLEDIWLADRQAREEARAALGVSAVV